MTASPSDSPEPTTETPTPEPEELRPSDGPPPETEQATTDARTAPDADTAGEPSAEAEQPTADAPAPKPDAGKKKPKKKKPAGPDPAAVIKAIGVTSEAALAYVQNPDPKLSRMARKHREVIITEIPPVTAGALLGPEALCRHFLASAASGRYRDLFCLWDLFALYPEACKAVLNARQKAQEKAKAKLRSATLMGLLGDADRVAADIDRAAGLPWRWLKEILAPMEPAIVQRPAVLAAMTRRVEGFSPDLPVDPSDRWLAEAAAVKESGKDIPEAMDALLGAHADRLPATVATLSMAQQQYPDRVSALIDRVDLDAPDIEAIMAWARDHGHGDHLIDRVRDAVESLSAVDRAAGLAAWKRWQERGVDLPLPDTLTVPTLDGLDLGRPESAELVKVLIDAGAPLDPQKIMDDVAADNRMRGEKAFEAFVCAGFDDVHLPLVLEGNPMVRPETRCPACQAWTWVRPGLEKRCPRQGCPLREAPATIVAEETAPVDAAAGHEDGVTGDAS